MKLQDLASVLRSKNAGPTCLTIDILFVEEAHYRRALESHGLRPESIARIYGLPVEAVRVIPCGAAMALKVVLERQVIAGSPGDRDVYGAQQHAPLLEVEL